MRTYLVRDRSGAVSRITAAAVVFETTHVVFTDTRGRIVFAPLAQNVTSLSEDGHDGSVS